MKNFFLYKRYVGFLFVLAYSLFVAHLEMGPIKNFALNTAPQLKQEAAAFTPIKIADGAFESPKNFQMSKIYGTTKLVVDTRVDDWDFTNLAEGIYVARKNIYVVKDGGKTVKVHSVYELPSMQLEKDDVESFMDFVINNAGINAFVIAFFSVFVGTYILLFIYSFVIEFFIPVKMRMSFSQIKNINSIFYPVWKVSALYLGFPQKFWIAPILLLVINFIIGKLPNKENS